jgi:hypothetical protein
MTEATGSQTFEEIVKWAYSTLPQKIKELPDFPGIQIAEEPPVRCTQEDSGKEELASGKGDAWLV